MSSVAVKWPKAGRIGAASASALALTLTGCGLFGPKPASDPTSYQAQAAHDAPLDVPPDLSPLGKDERFAMPDQPASANALRSAGNAAPNQRVAVRGAHARLMRDGGQRWLAVDVAPEAAYQVAKEFMTAAGWKLRLDEPTLGIIETDWQESHASVPEGLIQRAINLVLESVTSTGVKDEYRIRIERTPTDTSEIYITQRGLEEVYSNTDKTHTIWQPRPRDPELEAELMQRLLLRFEANDSTVASKDAGAVAAPAKAATVAALPGVSRVVKDKDSALTHLEVDEPFDRAWRRVGLALDRGGFTVEDRDRTKGLYFVRYLDPDYVAQQRDKRNIFSRVFDSDPKVDAQQFRVALATEGERTWVRVQDKEGKPEVGATGDRILQQLDEQMR